MFSPRPPTHTLFTPKELQAVESMQHLLQSQEIQISQGRRVQSQHLRHKTRCKHKQNHQGAPNPKYLDGMVLPPTCRLPCCLCTLEGKQEGLGQWTGPGQATVDRFLSLVLFCACPLDSAWGGAGGLFAFGKAWALCLSEVNPTPLLPFWSPDATSLASEAPRVGRARKGESSSQSSSTGQ